MKLDEAVAEARRLLDYPASKRLVSISVPRDVLEQIVASVEHWQIYNPHPWS
jgi:hypothetical protein